MRRICTTCWTTLPLILAVALLTACSPKDIVNMTGAGEADQENDEVEAISDEQQPEDDTPDREVAAAGVGKKGRIEGEGLLRSPIKAYFTIPQRLAFEALIPHAIQIYKANDPQGKGPRTHEIFMKEIIEKEQIQLPELPEGDRYEYDPEEEQLYVIHPK